jgi:hypothetical protein
MLPLTPSIIWYDHSSTAGSRNGALRTENRYGTGTCGTTHLPVGSYCTFASSGRSQDGAIIRYS